jgi:ABC-type sugar transport system ATPase subunit
MRRARWTAIAPGGRCSGTAVAGFFRTCDDPVELERQRSLSLAAHPTLKEWIVRARRAAGSRRCATNITLTLRRAKLRHHRQQRRGSRRCCASSRGSSAEPRRGRHARRARADHRLGTGFDGESPARNVFFNGSLLGRSRAFMKRCEDEIIDFSGLAPHIDAPLRTYSTGMVARLAFAIATTIEAEIVLLDEVLAVGDAAFKQKCSERIRGFHSNGATIVLVSHELDSVRDLCSRAAWVEKGEIRAIGAAEDVIAAYERKSAEC